MSQQHILAGSAGTPPLEGNYLNGFLGSELGWSLGFIRRFPTHSGTVLRLRRVSTGDTLDVDLTDNSINFLDSSIVSFVAGFDVEAKRIYSQFPAANQLFPYVEGPDGECPIIYENDAWVTLTGTSIVSLDFKGTKYLEGVIFPVINQQTLYQLAVAEFNGSGDGWTQNITQDGASLAWQGLRFRSSGIQSRYRNTSQNLTAEGGSDTTNSPAIGGYQELETSRVTSENGVDVATGTGTAALNATGLDRFFWGKMRSTGSNDLYGNIISAESCGFLDPKVADKLAIEAVVNQDYNF